MRDRSHDLAVLIPMDLDQSFAHSLDMRTFKEFGHLVCD
jgi:hypothetical protein